MQYALLIYRRPGEHGRWYLVEVDDLDGALEIAARIPALHLGGTVEVRPVAAAPH